MVKNQWKNYRFRIWIFTRIESILPCHTPNMSTKFRPNPSTTFWNIVLYVIFGHISQWWRITLKILVVGSGYGSSPKIDSVRPCHTHPTCPQHFIRIRPQLFEISCTKTNKQTDKQEEGVVQSTILAKSIVAFVIKLRWKLRIYKIPP